MSEQDVHECNCDDCLPGADSAIVRHHYRVNLLVSRLDEQQRRWLVATESMRLGHGGDRFMAKVTGMNVETIARGRKEVSSDLENRPVGRVRLPGGGRPRAKKKTKD